MNHFSFSQHSLYLECPRKYKFRYVDHIKPHHENFDAANFGTILHFGLHHLYLSKGDIDLAKEKLHTKYDELFSTPHEKFSLAHAEACLQTYFRAKKFYISEVEIVSAEVEDSFTLHGVSITYIIDLIVRYKDEVIVIDFKTSGFNPGDRSMDLQADYYLWAAKAYQPDRLVFDQIMTTKVPKLEEFPAFRSSYELEKWTNDVGEVLTLIGNDVFPRNQLSCYKFFKLCPYANLCFASTSQQEEFNLKNFYKEKEANGT